MSGIVPRIATPEKVRAGNSPSELNLLVDSTGIKFLGDRAWQARKHCDHPDPQERTTVERGLPCRDRHYSRTGATTSTLPQRVGSKGQAGKDRREWAILGGHAAALW
jgi:hypothetical protein